MLLTLFFLYLVTVLQFHRFSFDCAMSTESCTQSICDLALKFGEKGKDDDSALVWSFYPLVTFLSKDPAHPLMFCLQSRPFGVALLVAGVDEEGPRLSVVLSLVFPLD